MLYIQYLHSLILYDLIFTSLILLTEFLYIFYILFFYFNILELELGLRRLEHVFRVKYLSQYYNCKR